MKTFLSRFHALVLFTLSGFDRLRVTALLCAHSANAQQLAAA